MRDKARIDEKTGFAYIPLRYRKDGLVGDVEILTDADTTTLVLIKPGVSPESVRKSLQVIVRILDLRIAEQNSALELPPEPPFRFPPDYVEEAKSKAKKS